MDLLVPCTISSHNFFPLQPIPAAQSFFALILSMLLLLEDCSAVVDGR